MSMVAVVGASVGATACYALSTALKHRSTATVPETAGLAPHKLFRFATATARHPLYLAAILAGTVGLALQVLALHIGALSVVQPLLTTALLFSLIAAHRIAGTRISARELRWGAMLVVALVGFMLAAGTVHAHIPPHAQHADRVPAILAGVLALTLATSCVLTSRRLPRGGAAALMGSRRGDRPRLRRRADQELHQRRDVRAGGAADQLAALPLPARRRCRPAADPAGVPVRAPVREPAGDHHRRPAAQRGHRCLGVRRAAEGGPGVGASPRCCAWPCCRSRPSGSAGCRPPRSSPRMRESRPRRWPRRRPVRPAATRPPAATRRFRCGGAARCARAAPPPPWR